MDKSLTKTKTVDIYAPILPGEGLGNLRLNMHISEVKAIASEIDNFDEFIGTRYDEQGKLDQLGVLANYPGTLFGAIRPGMKLSEIMRLEPRLFYDESEDAFFIEGVQGIVLEMDFPPLDPLENPEETTLYSIIVYRPEDFHIEKDW